MTDIEIANSVKGKDIISIGKSLGLEEEDIVCYGKRMAKIKKEKGRKSGKLILVTAISPTPYGEGKTTVSIGLADALKRLGKQVSLSLREPSLGPVFGLKGGACGGGYSQMIPMENINLHFTGDFHTITSCNNLISASIYNHIEHGNTLGFEEVLFERCLDVNDRSLRNIHLTCGKEEYLDHFNITSASEIMALFCLADDLSDLKRRLSKIVVGKTKEDKFITVADLKLEGALTALLKDAFLPNLVQTLEETPVFVHGGPFANIAHGCSSVRSIKLAQSLSDYVITEAGFGSDLGGEKFLNLVCSNHDMIPNTIVLVVTIRAIKYHGEENIEKGLSNLEAHINHLENYHVPIVVALNQFREDQKEEIRIVEDYCRKKGIAFAVTSSYQDGGKGAITLGESVLEQVDEESKFQSLVTSSMTVEEKLKVLGEKVYCAREIEYSEKAKKKLKLLKKNHFASLPICVAKTQYSISDDAKKIGYPKDNILHVTDIKLNSGASFITVLLGNIMTMPGLPKHANYEKIDVIDDKIIGIF